MPLFESMKSSFNQPLIPVVLRALMERHLTFGNVCNKNSPPGEQSELIDRFGISVNHQLKASHVHHFKGGVRAGTTSAGIFFLCSYRLADFKTEILLNAVCLQYLLSFDVKRIGGIFGLGFQPGQFALGFIQPILKRFFLTLRMCMAATDHPSLRPLINRPVLKLRLDLFIHDKALAHNPIIVILIFFRLQHNFLVGLGRIQKYGRIVIRPYP